MHRPMAEALHIAADSHRQLSNYGQAEELCNQALAICTSIGDDLVRAGALFELGLIYKSQPN
ncbi:hypothetical protein M407DRAFT_31874 [Tulasnella calospora MUT 4182]|uniref:Anaphase-promoting complex subunit 5 domain-containing protein n=1 Tax=Tulasnella calospora MUT 4182 TaxID=1051891 RepID=A0A0C3Q5Q0_9AGAM|nr:hypothetical protein M407DRAFT_31874 [Tulasnella calospora MUT 4182]